jgi:hypothetical protein
MAVVRRLLGAVLRRLECVTGPTIDWLFNRQIYAKLRQRKHVLCIGDSHVEVMCHVRIPGVWFRIQPVVGATASGVMNPNGITHSLSIFTTRLTSAKPWHEVLIQLGEVDCGFVIWHRAQRHGLNVAEQLSYTLDTYTAFIEKVASMGFRKVIVLSAPLPTISDNPLDWGEVANLRAEVTATQLERTTLTLSFNTQLRERCETIDNVGFVDTTTGHLNPATGLVDQRFLSTILHDHHLEKGPYAQLISRELRRLWSSYLRPSDRA